VFFYSTMTSVATLVPWVGLQGAMQKRTCTREL